MSPPKLASKGRHKRAEPTSPTASENVEELDDELSPRDIWKLYGLSPPAKVRQQSRPQQTPGSSSDSQPRPVQVPQLVLDSQETVEEVVSSQEDRLGLCLRASCVSCMYIC